MERRARANGLPAVPATQFRDTKPHVVCLSRAARRYVALVTFADSGHAVAAFTLATRNGRDFWSPITITGDTAAAALRKSGIRLSLFALGD